MEGLRKNDLMTKLDLRLTGSAKHVDIEVQDRLRENKRRGQDWKLVDLSEDDDLDVRTPDLPQFATTPVSPTSKKKKKKKIPKIPKPKTPPNK